MTDTTRTAAWIAALNRLERERDACIACPVCGVVPLRVYDTETPAEPGFVRFSRWLACDACRASVAASGKRPTGDAGGSAEPGA